MVRRIFTLGAVRGDFLEFLVSVWGWCIRDCCLDQPLRHEISVAPVGRGRVRVVARRQAEVSTVIRRPWTIDDILTGTEQLHDREGEIGKSFWVCRAPLGE